MTHVSAAQTATQAKSDPAPTSAPNPAASNHARFFNHGRYCYTGGMSTRDAVWQHCWTPDNRCNTVMEQVNLGGPLDAPEVMPAGSVEGLTCKTFDGRPRPTTTTFNRG